MHVAAHIRPPSRYCVTELAVVTFPAGHATLIETAPGVSIAQVIEATEAELTISPQVQQMQL